MDMKSVEDDVKKGAIIIEGHVQGLSNTRSLGEANIPVFIVDKNNCIARYSRYCTKFFRCPDYNSNEFSDFLIELAQKQELSGWVLIPSNDHAVYCISKHKKRLEEYYKVITPSLDIVEKIYDKSKLLQITSSIGIPIPKTQYFNSVSESLNGIDFPVLTKGRFGLSFYHTFGKKAMFAKNSEELSNQLKEISLKYDLQKTFTQEVIPFDGTNKTISFTAFCIEGEVKTYWMGVKLREHPTQFGTATFAKSTYVEDCLKQSKILLKALNYSGVCEVEFIKEPRDGFFKLIEINPRTWLWVGLAKSCGVDYAKLVYNFVNDRQNVYPENYLLDRSWINPFTDTFYSTYAIAKGELKLKNYLKSIFQEKLDNALFTSRDPMPGFIYFLNLFNFLAKR